MESALYPIHALMRSFTTWEDLLLPEHQRRQQQFFSASENFRYTGSMIRVKQRPSRNIHIATQSSDCSWENQEFIHFATSFYQYPISICLKIDETHIRPAVLFREKEILTGKFSSLFDVFGRFYLSVMITCSRGSNLWRSWSLQRAFRSPTVRI